MFNSIIWNLNISFRSVTGIIYLKEMDDAKLERLRAAKLEGKDGKDVDALIEKVL